MDLGSRTASLLTPKIQIVIEFQLALFYFQCSQNQEQTLENEKLKCLFGYILKDRLDIHGFHVIKVRLKV